MIRFWANDYAVQLTMRRQRNLHYFKWIQSKFREKEKIFVACLRSQEKRLIRKFYLLKFLGLAVQQRQINPTEKRASPYTSLQSNQCLLVKTHWLNFLTFQKAPFNREFDGHKLPCYVLLYLAIIDWGRVGYEGFCRSRRRMLSASVDNTLLLDLQNSSYPSYESRSQ